MMVMKTQLPSTNMACVNELYIISYNMHGFNQGIEAVSSLLNGSDSPDVILLQEHWLTPPIYFFLERKLALIMLLVYQQCLTVSHRVHWSDASLAVRQS